MLDDNISFFFHSCYRWLFFPPKDLPCLYPIYSPFIRDTSFEVDLPNPDLNKHPLLSLTSPQECILEPGEVLFVPAGSPHSVDNLDASLAISANYVDLSNLNRVKEELKVDSLMDPSAAELLSVVQCVNFCTDMDEQQEMLIWNHFKKWPRNIKKILNIT